MQIAVGQFAPDDRRIEMIFQLFKYGERTFKTSNRLGILAPIHYALCQSRGDETLQLALLGFSCNSEGRIEAVLRGAMFAHEGGDHAPSPQDFGDKSCQAEFTSRPLSLPQIEPTLRVTGE